MMQAGERLAKAARNTTNVRPQLLCRMPVADVAFGVHSELDTSGGACVAKRELMHL
jgi:hypothetical protein